ncbi:unnamed protein product [Pleuronectes platessa]|uniref:Uncharacterized protein n=1 Tax=Pleuronectes platessa TaxID=8262 RepID=A0A9N7YNJ6_PLEPL|nr:unnamed protein product [Pleuronectes platessa]
MMLGIDPHKEEHRAHCTSIRERTPVADLLFWCSLANANHAARCWAVSTGPTRGRQMATRPKFGDGVCGGSSSEHLQVNQGEFIGTAVVNNSPWIKRQEESCHGERHTNAEDTETEKYAWTKLS